VSHNIVSSHEEKYIRKYSWYVWKERDDSQIMCGREQFQWWSQACVNVGLSQKLKKGQLYEGGVTLHMVKLEWDMWLFIRLWNGWDPYGGLVWFGVLKL